MFEIGQKVKINPLSKEEKNHYFGGWTNPMDDYIGQIVTIKEHVGFGCYLVEENVWLWDSINLSLIEE